MDPYSDLVRIEMTYIPPCPPEAVAVSEDEEGGLTVLGTCPEKGEKGVFTHACSCSLSYPPSNQVWCPAVNGLLL